MSRHRPSASTGGGVLATLPPFSFNATNATGLQSEAALPPLSVSAPTTPSRGLGHRRNQSAMVGGVGMGSGSGSGSGLSVSPTKTHRHRRSLAWSHHDAGSMMQPSLRLSTSLPNTPLEASPDSQQDAFSEAGPPSSSRRHVGFSANVEYIPRPRPLSTISSATESSGHTINNSITSVWSMHTPSPPGPRSRATTLATTLEHPTPLPTFLPTPLPTPLPSSLAAPLAADPSSPHDLPPLPSPPDLLSSSLDLSSLPTPLDHLSSMPSLSSASSLDPPASLHPLPASPLASRQDPDPAAAPDGNTHALPRADHSPAKTRFRAGTKHLSRGSLGFDRRRSEPLLSAVPWEETTTTIDNYSFVDNSTPPPSDRRFSTRKIKNWAVAKIVRRSRPRSAILLPTAPLHPPPSGSVAETDLDAVFNRDPDPVPMPRPRTALAASSGDPQPQPWFCHQTTLSHSSRVSESEEVMLDLDDALGRPRTPTPLASRRSRRPLHSDRALSDFSGPGAHYQPSPPHHRTATVAPLLVGDPHRSGSPPTPALAVFDEEEEEEQALVLDEDKDGVQEGDDNNDGEDEKEMENEAEEADEADEEALTGISVVELDTPGASVQVHSRGEASLDEGLGAQQSVWDWEAPAYRTAARSRLSHPIIVKSPSSSIIEQTIVEECISAEPVDVGAARAHSWNKSSDSSEAPTILAASPSLRSLPPEQASAAAPAPAPATTSAVPPASSSPECATSHGSWDQARLGTSTSSLADNRTVSSCTTVDGPQELWVSVDDVPSLTSSRSTMGSTVHANSSRRDVSGLRTPSVISGPLESAATETPRRKRRSIQSLSQLVGVPFGPRSLAGDSVRPSTAATALAFSGERKKDSRKEHRLKKLMFWKSSRSLTSSDMLPLPLS